MRAGYSRARSFAKALGLKENRYSRYERAETEPDLMTLHRICDTLRVRPDELLGYQVTDEQQASIVARQQRFQKDGARLHLILKATQRRVTESLGIVEDLWALDDTP